MTSSVLPTKARMAVRVVTEGVLFEDGDGGDRKGDLAPKKVALWSEGGFETIEAVFLLLCMVDEYFSHLPSYI